MFARKYRIHAILILSVLIIIFVPQFTNKPDKATSAAAVAAATDFLRLVDAGRYADSWQLAAKYLQKKIPREEWVKKLKKIRSTYGPLIKRNLEDVNFTAAVKELPEQKLILLKYASTFKLKAMSEVVTVIQGTDDHWLVIGYFIQ